jgi:uncharacterized protein
MTTALITGASSGLGEEFALQLAREKFDLVLVARREDKLKSVAERAHGRRAVAESGEIGYLVNNAGFGTNGRFDSLPLAREIEEIDLNITSLVALTRICLPAMVARRQGIVINVASTAAFQPVPWMATYGATKAFVLSFSEALAEELRGTGVTITALCPGPTRTEFQSVAHNEDASFPAFAYMDAATVVRQAIAAARDGKAVKINGAMNLLMAQTSRVAPRALVRRIAGSMFRER